MMKILVLTILATCVRGEAAKDGNKECMCATVHAPVCASSKDTAAKTYSNKCVATCALGEITKIADGECKQTRETTTTAEPKTKPTACRCEAIDEPVCVKMCEAATCTTKTFANKCEATCKQLKYTDGKCDVVETCDCPEDYTPLCGTNKDGKTKTFSNKCHTQVCAGGPGEMMKYADGECEEEKECICTKDYSPVCGTNSDGKTKTFSNKCLTQVCAGGPGEKMKYTEGECKEEKECICTREFIPVCGTTKDGRSKTFSNKCEATCANVKYTEGECEERCIKCFVRPQCNDDCTGKCVLTKPTCEACGTATCDEGDDETATCTLSNGKEVKAGWSGAGVGDNSCNRCKCSDTGDLLCTKKDCTADDEEKPTSGCHMSDRTIVPFGWSGAGRGKNHCNKCKCSAPTDPTRPPRPVTKQPATKGDSDAEARPAKPSAEGGGKGEEKGEGKDEKCTGARCGRKAAQFPLFTKGVLRCTEMECTRPVAEESEQVDGDKPAGTKPVNLVGSTTNKFWETTCQRSVCKNDFADCADCNFEADRSRRMPLAPDADKTEKMHDRCKRACKVGSSLDKAGAEKEEKNKLGFGDIKANVRDADTVDAKGLGREAAGIQAKCAAVTTDCVEDDVECACPSEVSSVVRQHTKGRTVAQIAEKIHCCRDVGDKDVDAIKEDIKTKLTGYVASSRAELAALAEQVAECDADAAAAAEGEDVGEAADTVAEESSQLCESFALINDASTAELQEMVAAAATMSAEEIADVIGNLSGAAEVAGSALVAAALAAVASL